MEAVTRNLNKFAFRIIRQLDKQDPAKAAHNIRALNLYIDMLGLAAQTDLEDAIDDKAVQDVIAHGGGVALDKFRNKIAGAERAFIDKQLERFCADWPELAKQAERIALEAA